MSSLSNYSNDLQKIADNLDYYIKKIIIDNEGKILSMLKLRLFNTGTDAKGNLITPEYSENTLIRKKSKGQRASFVTLRDVGDFYAGMFVNYTNNELFISSKDNKTEILIEKYGPDILGLNLQEQEVLIQNIIEPEIQKILNSLSNQIEIEL